MEAIPESGTGGGEEWTKVKEGKEKQQINTERRKDAGIIMCLILKLCVNALGLTFSKQQSYFSAVLDKLI